MRKPLPENSPNGSREAGHGPPQHDAIVVNFQEGATGKCCWAEIQGIVAYDSVEQLTAEVVAIHLS
jgi:hypothetical protein